MKNASRSLAVAHTFLTLAAAGAPACFAAPKQAADPGHLTIQTDKPGAKINPLLYGLMTEEINYSYDGGLYGELIQNRIFENAAGGGAAAAAIPHWSVITTGQGKGTIAIDAADPVNATALKKSLRLDIASAGPDSDVGIANDGYWGIPVRPDSSYQASFYAKAPKGTPKSVLVSLVGDDGKAFVSSSVNISDKWQQYKVTLKTPPGITATSAAKFVISAHEAGSVSFSLVSLFPPTFKTRGPEALGSRPVTGFRPDLMQLLDNMHPAFLRFPGGNYVEGQDLANRFNWKQTIGPWEDRPGHESPWRYRSSDGMGLLEFLEWCEDLKMEPLLAVYAGYNLNRQAVPPADYQKYADEAVEEIEYVTGDASTKWGAQRAKDGHPAPFHLTYVEIGNEDNLGGGAATYDARFTVFYDAIKAKYPKLLLISSAGTTRLTGRKADLQDEHHYPNNVAAALALASSFDNRPRNGARVFVGEWATRLTPRTPTPNFNEAMCDAAFMCGVERNADLVQMFCYAPLLVNLNTGAMQWPVDMIGYNALNSFGSPAYYVEKMFYNNRGDTVLPIAGLTPQMVPPGAGNVPPLFAAAAREDKTGEIILKVVNSRDVPQQLEVNFQGAQTIAREATGEILTGDLTAANSIAAPKNCVPKPLAIADAGVKWVHEFPGNSVTVLRFKTK